MTPHHEAEHGPDEENHHIGVHVSELCTEDRNERHYSAPSDNVDGMPRQEILTPSILHRDYSAYSLDELVIGFALPMQDPAKNSSHGSGLPHEIHFRKTSKTRFAANVSTAAIMTP